MLRFLCAKAQSLAISLSMCIANVLLWLYIASQHQLPDLMALVPIMLFRNGDILFCRASMIQQILTNCSNQLTTGAGAELVRLNDPIASKHRKQLILNIFLKTYIFCYNTYSQLLQLDIHSTQLGVVFILLYSPHNDDSKKKPCFDRI